MSTSTTSTHLLIIVTMVHPQHPNDTANTWAVMEQYNITTLAYLYKHYVHTSNNSNDNEYFGTYGERTNEMKGQHRGLVAFLDW